jgi:alkylation response protein AidB-like acyl-CoA dehydrogenase
MRREEIVDLTLDDRQREFDQEVRRWLVDNVPDVPLPDVDTDAGFDAHRRWERTLAEAGYAGVSWPEEFGGLGHGPDLAWIFSQAYWESGAPARVNHVGLNLSGPTIMARGTTEQKERWLPGILDASEIWAQALSEPGAGSDLASLTTAARRDGDEFVVRGAKVWTTLGPRADRIYTLVRTGGSGTGHAGLTVLAIDARSPGLTRRGIHQLDERTDFSELFFDDVRVPAGDVIGDVDDGWSVVMTTLGFERGSVTNSPAGVRRLYDEVARIAVDVGGADDPVVRHELARDFAAVELYRIQSLRNLTLDLAGGLRWEESMAKVVWSETNARLFARGEDLLGASGGVTDAAAAGRDWSRRAWYARAGAIYGGANEVQRNIIAERQLGLPREPKGTR